MLEFIDDIIGLFRKDPRIDAMHQLARHNKWAFKAREKFATNNPRRELPLLKSRKGKRMHSIMGMSSSMVEGHFYIYDYVYFGDFGKKMTTVFEYGNAALDLTLFTIRPKSKFDSMKEFFVSPDFLFITTPEFEQRYQIDAADTISLKHDINEDFLDMIGDTEGWTYEGVDQYLIAYQPGIQCPVNEIHRHFNRFEKLAERLINGTSISKLGWKDTE